MMCILNACHFLTFKLIIHLRKEKRIWKWCMMYDVWRDENFIRYFVVIRLSIGKWNVKLCTWFFVFNLFWDSFISPVCVNAFELLVDLLKKKKNIVETNVSESLIQLNHLRQTQSSIDQCCCSNFYSNFQWNNINNKWHGQLWWWLSIQIRQLHT